MGSYAPRHLKRTSSPLRGRSLALAASAAMIIPVLAATEASAAPIAKTAVAPAAVPAAKVAVGPTLSYGASGSAVRVLQTKLRAKGYKISVDGSFGPKTRAAVRSFQAKARVGVSGVVGAGTWRALGGYTAPAATSRSTSRPAAPSASGSKVLSIAYRYLGVPYRVGGNGPRSFDCSGLTSYVYRQLGVNLPRTARAQQAALPRTSSPRPGDLVFFGYPAYHVGIYVSPGRMIAAPHPGTVVRVQDIYVHPSGYGRVL